MTVDDTDADGDASADPDAAAGDHTGDEEVVVELQQALRSELKDPLGPIYTDPETLLSAAGRPLVTVGDIVTYHLTMAGYTPDVALVDGRTKRASVDDHVEAAIGGDTFDREVHVGNEPATLSDGLLVALREALTAASDGTTTVVVVDGEEDLAALPAVVAAPAGASVVYGQPDEGMVLVDCDGGARATVRDLLGRMDGDTGRLWDLLGVED